MSDVQQSNSLNEGFPLDAEEAILAKWEDAEKPSEDEAEATQDDPEETTDIIEEEILEETDDQEEVETDPDDEETEDETEDDESEDDEVDTEATEVSDDTELEVIVDGESKMVSVANLKRLAGQEASLTQKSQLGSSQRKEVEATIEKNHLVFQKMLNKAQERYKPYSEVDMLVASKTMETEDFAQLRKEAQDAYDDLKFLNEEADTFYKDIKEQSQAQQRDAAKECVKVLQEDIPDWSNALYDDIRSFAVKQGLPEDQVNQYVDPNVIKLINMARLYDEGKKVALVKKKSATAKKVLRTKKTPDPKASTKANAERARQKMVASGGRGLDDIAAAILGSWET